MAAYPKLIEMESTEKSSKKYKETILEILKDAPRSGSPPQFIPEQVAYILSIGCEVLDDSDRPTSRWTHKEVIQEAINRKVVETISPSSVGRFFKRCSNKTHKTVYWLNTTCKDPEKFKKEFKEVCDILMPQHYMSRCAYNFQ